MTGAHQKKTINNPAEHLYESHNDTPEKAKLISIGLLNARLAETIDLALATKQAHWNLKGRQFIAVHEMLDGFRDQIDEWTDSMAERVVQLGGIAMGTTQVVGSMSTLPAYPTDIGSIDQHLQALAERYGRVANAVRKAIDTSDAAGDPDTADILTEASRGLDKQLWLLEAHLQD